MNKCLGRKRLLIVNHATSIGGASVSLEHILRSIDGTEWEVTVYCKSDRSDFADRLESLGYRVVRGGTAPTPFAHFSGSEFVGWSISAIANYVRILRDCVRIWRVLVRGFDLVLVNSMTLFWVGRIAGTLGIRAGCFHRETLVNGRWGLRTGLIKRELLHAFHGVAYISKFDQAQVGDSRRTSVVMTDKVDLGLYADVSRAEARRILGLPEGFLVLYLGGMGSLKGPDVILRAVAMMDPRISLIFMGASSLWDHVDVSLRRVGGNSCERRYVDELRDIIESPLMRGRVLFRPGDDSVHLYYIASDLVVFPSSVPHQGRPVYESGAAKRVLVISDFDETKEFAQSGANCIEFPPGDSRTLADCVNAVFRNPSAFVELTDENWRRTNISHDLRTLPREVSEFLGGLM